MNVTHEYNKQTCSVKVGEWMQWKSFRQSCNTRCLITPSTTSTPFRCRSFTGSRVVMPFGLASANRRISWVAVEIAWPGGSSLGREVYLLSVPQFNKCKTIEMSTYTPEAWLLSFIVVVDDSLWNDLEGFGCDGRDVLQLQFLHRMTAGSYTHSHTVNATLTTKKL